MCHEDPSSDSGSRSGRCYFGTKEMHFTSGPQGQPAQFFSILQPACAGKGYWEQRGCPLSPCICCGHRSTTQAGTRWLEVTDTPGPSDSPQGDTSPGLVCNPTPEHRHVRLWIPARPLIGLQGNILQMKVKMSVAVSHTHSTSPTHPRTLHLHRCTRHTHTHICTLMCTHTQMHAHVQWYTRTCM